MTRLSRQEQAARLRQAFATEQERAKTTAASLATMHPLFDGILKAHGAPPAKPAPVTAIVYDDVGAVAARFTGSGYATRCATVIAEENLPDARWAFAVLNQYGHLVQHEADRLAKPDPRDPDHSRTGMFVNHNCYKCGDGDRPCVRGNPRQCDYPRARND